MTADTAPHYMTENGAVHCKRHRPSSDFRTSKLRATELVEWREMITNIGFGPDAPLCETCRTVAGGAA